MYFFNYYFLVFFFNKIGALKKWLSIASIDTISPHGLDFRISATVTAVFLLWSKM